MSVGGGGGWCQGGLFILVISYLAIVPFIYRQIKLIYRLRSFRCHTSLCFCSSSNTCISICFITDLFFVCSVGIYEPPIREIDGQTNYYVDGSAGDHFPLHCFDGMLSFELILLYINHVHLATYLWDCTSIFKINGHFYCVFYAYDDIMIILEY